MVVYDIHTPHITGLFVDIYKHISRKDLVFSGLFLEDQDNVEIMDVLIYGLLL